MTAFSPVSACLQMALSSWHTWSVANENFHSS